MIQRFVHKIGVINKHIQNIWFDFRVTKHLFGFAGTYGPVHSGAYQTQSVDYVLMKRALENVRFDRSRRIVDLGSGKGRLLAFLARKFPGKDILGYELNPEIASLSREMLKGFSNIHVISGDFFSSDLSAVDVLILFNPFGASELERLFRKIEAHPKPVGLLYINLPPTHDVALNTLSSGKCKVFISSVESKWEDISGKRNLYLSNDPGHFDVLFGKCQSFIS